MNRKVNLEPFKAADIHFLTLLKNQVTIAVSNSLIYDRVEELVKLRTDELLHAQKQLVQSEKLATVGTLAGGVAHEINNPLTAILTNVQMLLQSVNAPDDHESLELIEEATKRCRTIVQKLMTYSRKPLAERQPTSLDILKILNTVIDFLRYQLEQENIAITLQQKQDSFVVEGCKSELEQVFTNLILNAKDAIKAVKQSGEIAISLTKHKKNIIINVTDEGCGIHQQELTKIFDPFFTTKDVGKGTGLGLSICQSIIAEHHGDIKVSSAPGKGSTFTIVLPASKAFTAEGSSILQ